MNEVYVVVGFSPNMIEDYKFSHKHRKKKLSDLSQQELDERKKILANLGDLNNRGIFSSLEKAQEAITQHAYIIADHRNVILVIEKIQLDYVEQTNEEIEWYIERGYKNDDYSHGVEFLKCPRPEFLQGICQFFS